MTNHRWTALWALGFLGCSGNHLFVGQDGAGGSHPTGGAGGLPALPTGAGGSTPTAGAAGTILPTSSGGAGGQPGSGGAPPAAGGSPVLPTLELVAGALGGPGTADGIGATARFYFPLAITWDGGGNLYVADGDNETIRQIEIATGSVTTLAGQGRQTGAADGLGAAATFGQVKGVTCDGAGNLFVADSAFLRKVVIATRQVITLADASGAPLWIDGASDLTSDGAGHLYVAVTNTGNGASQSLIRRVDVTTGTMTTLADRSGVSVQFDAISGIASDHAGNLYVADGTVIKKIAVATGAVTVLTGSRGSSGSDDGTGAAARLSGSSGIVLDGAGNLFIAEGTGLVRRLALATGTVTTLAGQAGQRGSQDGTGAAAAFDTPRGIATDGAGNLYVADQYNSTIRKVAAATGAVTTLAGVPHHEATADGTGTAARFGLPGGVAADGDGNLYVVDRDGDTIRKVVRATGVVTTLAGKTGESGSTDGSGPAARFAAPSAVTSDGAGNLFVTDGNVVRAVVMASGAVTTLAGAADQTAGSADGTGAAARFDSPWGITADGAGNLYVADSYNHTIRQIAIAARAVTTLAGTPGQKGSSDGVGAAARFDLPSGVAVDGAGNLFVADSANATVRKVVLATGAVTTLAGAAGQTGSAGGAGAAARFVAPAGLAWDGAGHLFVADDTTIRQIAVASATVSTPIGIPGRWGVALGALPASLNVPYALAVLPTGDLAVVDTLENAVLVARFK